MLDRTSQPTRGTCVSAKQFAVRQDPGNIGRIAVVVYQDRCYVGTVLDQVAGTQKPKRVRVQYDPFLQGTVLQPHEYQFKTWADQDE